MTLRDVPRAPLIVQGLLLSLLLCLLAPGARAQAQPDPALSQPDVALSDWEQLSPEQREQLIDPLRERWNSQPQSRARLLDNAQRWQQMSPEQRERAQRGLKRLEQMTPSNASRRGMPTSECSNCPRPNVVPCARSGCARRIRSSVGSGGRNDAESGSRLRGPASQGGLPGHVPASTGMPAGPDFPGDGLP